MSAMDSEFLEGLRDEQAFSAIASERSFSGCIVNTFPPASAVFQGTEARSSISAKASSSHCRIQWTEHH